MPRRSTLPRGSGDTKTKRPGPRASAAPVFVRLDPEERREVVAAARGAALPIGVWARSVLLLAARAGRVPAETGER